MRKIILIVGVLFSSISFAGSIGTGGVKEAYDAGGKSSDGFTMYRVICNSGSGGTSFKKPDGYWYDDGGSNRGDDYRNLSLNDFANKACS